MSFPRRKERRLWLSAIYRLSRLPFASGRMKLRVFLDAEWFFARAAHEQFTRLVPPEENPFKLDQARFLSGSIPPGATILDLGCGYGHLAAYLSKTAGRVVAVDHNEEVLAQASRLHEQKGLEFRVGSAQAFLETEVEGFDVLVLSHVLEHLDDPGSFLARFVSRFRFVFIEVPDFDHSYLNLYREHFGVEDAYTDEDHISEFGREELRELVEGAGLAILRREYRVGVQRLWCEVLESDKA
ncbi:methyltransferase domain-containing protein [Gemmatimonadota bacterium]